MLKGGRGAQSWRSANPETGERSPLYPRRPTTTSRSYGRTHQGRAQSPPVAYPTAAK